MDTNTRWFKETKTTFFNLKEKYYVSDPILEGLFMKVALSFDRGFNNLNKRRALEHIKDCLILLEEICEGSAIYPEDKKILKKIISEIGVIKRHIENGELELRRLDTYDI
jgi:hypothetical protein